jgi:uncharacterized protein
MTRPCIFRNVYDTPRVSCFKPKGVPLSTLETVPLGLDELEAVRLADLEGLYQEEAAVKMGISRQTFGNIVESARKKIADALVHGKALMIEGGPVTVVGREFSCRSCSHTWGVLCSEPRPESCPTCGSTEIQRKDPIHADSQETERRECGAKTRSKEKS